MEQAQIELLVISAQRGNEEAFSQLISHFHPALIRFANRLTHNHELALDAVQETWISTSRTLRKLHDARAFRAWIYKTVRWRVLDQVRREKDNEDLAEQDIVDVSTNSDSTDSSKQQSELIELIKQLPPLEREVVYLFYLDDLTLIEISEILQAPVGTVKSRLNRARNMLIQQSEQD